MKGRYMVQADENDAGSGPGQYLVPGEVLLRSSRSVGIKKFIFNAYITDRRIFLVDQNEKKPGIISKDIPRDVVMGSHLESPGIPDPFLVLTIRTSEDETRTMKIAFVQAGNDRTAEIEEWISLLHGRPLRSVKSVIRHREATVTAHKDDSHKVKPHEKQDLPQNVLHEAHGYGTIHQRGQEKSLPVEPANVPVAASAYHGDERPTPGQRSGPVPDAGEISFCHHCGKRAPDGANFCPFCGTKLHRPGSAT
jgi:hypothetical protein